jgi:hypothetical protein
MGWMFLKRVEEERDVVEEILIKTDDGGKSEGCSVNLNEDRRDVLLSRQCSIELHGSVVFSSMT